jgi:hypothetical protein
MAIDYLDQLTEQAKAFVLAITSKVDPLTTSFALSPPASLVKPGGDGTVVTHVPPPRLALTPVELVKAPVEVGSKVTTVDLPLVGRWVRLPGLSPTGNPADEDPIGGMPVADHVPEVTGGLTSVTAGLSGTISTTLSEALPKPSLMLSETGQELVPGVPALLGRVAGTVTEVIKEIQEVLQTLDPIGVAAQVTVRVVDDRDPSGTVITDQVRISFDNGATWDPLTATSTAMGGTPLTFQLRLPVLVSELTAAPPEVVPLSVHVSVGLQLTPPVGGVIQTSIDLPPVPLLLPTIPIPTLVVLCEEDYFRGRKLVVVPSGSLLGKAVSAGGRPLSDAIAVTSQVLGQLRSALTAAPGLVAFADFLLGGQNAASSPAAAAAAVLASLADVPGQTLIVASSDLTSLDGPGMVFDEGWGMFHIGRATANYMTDSLVVVGRPGTTVTFTQKGGLLKELLSPLVVTLGAAQFACALELSLQPTVPFGTGVAAIQYPDSDPRSRMEIVFGGTVAAWSHKNHEDEICGVTMTLPPAGLVSGT